MAKKLKILILLFSLLFLTISISILLNADSVNIAGTEKKKVFDKQGSILTVWLPYWDEQRVLESIDIAGNQIDVALPMWYELKENGEISRKPSPKRNEIDKKLRSYGITIIPTITNEFEPKRVSVLLGNKELQKSQIRNLIELAEKENYEGWDFDLEQLDEKDKYLYVDFLKLVSEEFEKANLTLSVTVHPKTGTTADWEGSKGHDWEGIGKYADEIRIMVYDYHHKKSKAGAITPMSYLKDVTEYALDILPHNKIIIGLPMYGYDWVDRNGETVEFDNAMNLINEYEVVKAVRDSESKELYFEYEDNGVNHTVWFQDSESVLEKMDVVMEYGINKFSFWKLGGEDLNFWN